MYLRLLLLLLAIAALTVLVTKFGLRTSPPDEETEKSLISLPPVEKTRPLGMQPRAALRPVAASSAAPASPSTVSSQAPAESGGSTATGAATSSEPSSPSEKEAAAPAPETAAEKTPRPTLRWKRHEVAPGETLASIFKQLGLAPSLLHAIVTSSPAAGGLARLQPGQQLRFGFDRKEVLQKLVLQRNLISSLKVERTKKGFEAREEKRPVEYRQAHAEGTILSSLFVDGQKAGLDDRQIMELARLFGWDIDFALELRKGDRFSVIYQERWLDGKKIGNGPILAAEFINRGKVYRAIRYTDSHGETAYYDMEGNAKRRAFIRTPVKFSRISSRFTLRRWHPILKRWRSHKGVDYAAPEGTPVKATGNGRVTFIGRKGGYGKVIFLHHGSRYTTVYGHLSRFARGLKTGNKVKQGQIIGYVGHTGLATGPHLHYEFRVNGVHRNPLTVKLPKSIRLPRKELKRFRRTIQPLVAQLDDLRARSMVASAAKR